MWDEPIGRKGVILWASGLHTGFCAGVLAGLVLGLLI